MSKPHQLAAVERDTIAAWLDAKDKQYAAMIEDMEAQGVPQGVNAGLRQVQHAISVARILLAATPGEQEAQPKEG